MDVTGLYGLTAFARRLDERRIAFAYKWQPQPQPQRLLDLVDRLYPPAGCNGNRSGPIQPLRRSRWMPRALSETPAAVTQTARRRAEGVDADVALASCDLLARSMPSPAAARTAGGAGR